MLAFEQDKLWVERILFSVSTDFQVGHDLAYVLAMANGYMENTYYSRTPL